MKITRLFIHCIVIGLHLTSLLKAAARPAPGPEEAETLQRAALLREGVAAIDRADPHAQEKARALAIRLGIIGAKAPTIATHSDLNNGAGAGSIDNLYFPSGSLERREGYLAHVTKECTTAQDAIDLNLRDKPLAACVSCFDVLIAESQSDHDDFKPHEPITPTVEFLQLLKSYGFAVTILCGARYPIAAAMDRDITLQAGKKLQSTLAAAGLKEGEHYNKFVMTATTGKTKADHIRDIAKKFSLRVTVGTRPGDHLQGDEIYNLMLPPRRKLLCRDHQMYKDNIRKQIEPLEQKS